jgi:hypothetical protein
MAAAVASVLGRLRGVYETARHPIDSILLYSNDSLDELIKDLEQEEIYSDRITDKLKDLKIHPEKYGFKADFNRDDVDELIGIINEDSPRINRERYTAAMRFLYEAQGQSQSSVVKIMTRLERLLLELKTLPTELFKIPSSVHTILTDFTPESIARWSRNKTEQNLLQIFFRLDERDDLSPTQLEEFRQISTFLEQCQREEIEEAELLRFKALFSKLLENQMGLLRRVECSFNRTVQESLEQLEVKKQELKRALDDSLSEVDPSIIQVLDELRKVPNTDDKTDQLRQFNLALGPFYDSSRFERELFQIRAFGERATEEQQALCTSFFAALLRLRTHFDTKRATIEDCQPVFDCLEAIIQSKSGFITSSKRKLLELFEKEKIVAPPFLKNLLTQLIVINTRSPETDKEQLILLLEQFKVDYESSLNDLQSSQIDRLLLQLRRGDCPIESILQAQKIVLEIMKPLQGAFFSLIDQAKQELSDARTGIGTTLVSTLLQSVKTETLKEAPFALQQVYATALTCSSTRKFDLLRTKITELKDHDSLSTSEKSHLESFDPAQFDEWFTTLKNFKEQRQGLVPHFTDLLEERVKKALAPLSGMFNLFVNDQTDEPAASPSLYDRILQTIESTGHKATQYLAASTFRKIHEWIKRSPDFSQRPQDEQRMLNTFFEKNIESIEDPQFLNKEYRSSLVTQIRQQLKPYQFMIDKVLVLPNFYQATDDTKIQELIEAIEDQASAQEAIKTWLKDFEDEKIRHIFEETAATEDDTTLIIQYIHEIESENLENITKLKELVSSVIVDQKGIDTDHLNSTIGRLKEKKPVEQIDHESVEEIAAHFSETASFFFVYKACTTFLGEDNSLQKDHDKLVLEVRDLDPSTKFEEYHKRLEKMQYLERENRSFFAQMKELDPTKRKIDFFTRLNQIIDDSKANSINKFIIRSFAPILFDTFAAFSQHVINKAIQLIQEISVQAPTDISQRLNTDLIRQITGYLYKVTNTFHWMAQNNVDTAITDCLKMHLKEKIKFQGKEFSIDLLFSELNFKLVNTFIPDIQFSNYLEAIAELIADELNATEDTGFYLLKCVLLYPIYLLIEAMRLLIIIPLENLMNVTNKAVIWKILDLSNLTVNLVEDLFKNLNNKTGIYHIIKRPLLNLMEELDHEELFATKTDSKQTSILSQQDGAKRDIGELYAALKEAAEWFKEGLSMSAVKRKSKAEESGAATKGLIEQGIQKIETEFFSDSLAEILLEAYHKITQRTFLDKVVIGKGLRTLDKVVAELGHVEKLQELQEKETLDLRCDTQFKKKSKELMSNLFDQILKHALSELGSKQQKQIEDYFDFIKTELQNINFSELENFNDKSKREKVKILEQLRQSILKKTIELQNKKSSLEDSSISSETIKTINIRVKKVDQILEIVSLSLSTELENAKNDFEHEQFSSQVATLKTLHETLIEKFTLLNRCIDEDESIDFDEITGLIEQFSRQLAQIKPYSIDELSTIQPSKNYLDFKANCEKFLKSCQRHQTVLNDYYYKRLFNTDLGELKDSFVTMKIASLTDPTQRPLFLKSYNEFLNDLKEIGESSSYFSGLKELIIVFSKTTTEASARTKFAEFLAKVSLMIDEAKTSASSPDFESFSAPITPQTPDVEFIRTSSVRFKSAITQIQKISYLNFDLLKRTGLIEYGKQIILKKVRRDVGDYREFLNSREIGETFFYNCVLPTLIS